jgi:hypothetical protein
MASLIDFSLLAFSFALPTIHPNKVISLSKANADKQTLANGQLHFCS